MNRTKPKQFFQNIHITFLYLIYELCIFSYFIYFLFINYKKITNIIFKLQNIQSLKRNYSELLIIIDKEYNIIKQLI